LSVVYNCICRESLVVWNLCCG